MIRKTCINLISIISAAFWIVIFSAVIILPVDLSAQTSICFSIESESEQYLSDGTFDSGSSDLELGNDNTTPQIVGLRYTAVNIPSGAVVSNATIQFTADETSSGASNIDIAGELISNSTSFNENQVNNLSSRTLTNSTVNWIPFQWIAGVSGSRQKTPDLSPIINEILNTTGFTSGNAISFLITGTGKRTAINSPIDLCLTYSLCGTPAQPCNDGNPCTLNDVWDNNCTCIGTPDIDSDNDGVCDAIDPCPNSITNDSDNDGVCDDIDICLPGDDNVDIDNDNIPDDCDSCIDVNQNNICDDVDPAFVKNIFINEVNYRSVELQSNIEFIEIYNAETTSIDLTGWTLTDAVNYDFPSGTTISPGDYLVIAADPAECQAELNFSGALGPYIGNLSSQSDNIVLRNEDFFIVDNVDYKSWDEWPAVRFDDYSTIEPIPYNTTYTDRKNNKVAKSIQKTNPNLDGKHGGSWLASGPTPKAQNNNFTNNYSNLPVLKKVSKKPNNPTSGTSVIIKASFDEFVNYAGIMSVNLEYQVVTAGNYIAKSDNAYQNNWTSITMLDNSSGVDSLANDGVYTAAIPASAQVHRNLVRYRVKITSTAGYNKIYPDQNHTESNYAYYVYNGDANFNGYSFSNVNPLQNITIITKANVAAQYIGNGSNNSGQYAGYEYLGEGTLVYDGEVYDHIRFRPRGADSRSFRVKPGIKFDLNDEHKIKVRDDCGDSYKTKRDKLILSGTWVNDESSHGLVESLVYKILELTKGIFKYCDYTSLRIVDQSQETGNSGDFWGIYLIQEDYNEELLKEHDLPDGSIWTTYPSPRFLFVDHYGDFPGSQNQNVWFDPNVYSIANQNGQVTPPVNQLDKVTFFGDRIGNEIWANGERNYVAKHSYREYYNPETGLWVGWCKDYDGAFGSGDDVPAVSTTQSSNPNFDIIQAINVPTSLQIEYEGYLRSAYDLLLNQQQRNFLVDEETKIIYDSASSYDWTTLDHSRWSALQSYGEGNVDAQFQWYRNWFSDRANYLLNDNTHGIFDTRIPDKPTINLTGSNAIDNLTFSNSSFTDPQGNSTFESLQWRIGEWSDPSNSYYTTQCEAKYEIENHWVSNDITNFSASYTIPAQAKLKVGRTYMVRVRYKDNTDRWSHWSNPYTFKAQSALNQSTPDVVINEINYNPAEECGTEFIEIYNKENYSVYLDNYEFTDGIFYEFPMGSLIGPNKYLVLARDSIEFIQKYGFSPFGDYKNSLSNGGEQILLEGLYGRFVNYFTYADDNPWDTIPDGDGPSLSLANPALDNTLASNWAASKDNCGTPGYENNLCDNLQISASIIDVSCNNNSDGIITLSVAGGRSPYNYSWSGGSNSSTITGLAPGNYTVTITDAFLCTTTTSYTITEPTALQASFSKTDETMYQANDGTASINVSGGVGPYTYSWSNGDNTSTVNDLSPGNYTVTVFDSKGCPIVESFTIDAIVCSPINISTNVTNESLYQANDGSITTIVSNGTLPYAFSWSNGSTLQNQDDLAPGSYTLAITDAVGCNGSTTVTINPVICNTITVNTNITDDSCSGDGLIIISSISGGATPYSILWSTGITGTVANNLTAGDYDLTVTDVNGCLFNETYTVNSSTNISETISILPASSNTSSDGSIDLTVSGGSAPYSFNWSDGSTSEDLINVLPDTYSVTITDANNCSIMVNNIIVGVDVGIGVCVPQIVQTDEPALTSGLYRVSNFIESNGTIDNIENVSFKAGSYIELLNEFEVKQGAEFEAIIESCP